MANLPLHFSQKGACELKLKYKKHIYAVYPGSFDPITNGHICIAQRAAEIFEEVIVAVLMNAQKNPTFSVEERQRMAEEALADIRNVQVCAFSGLLVNFMRSQGSNVIIRGLRAMSDFEYEFQMALMNRQLAPDIETFFIVTEPKYSYLSSSAVKNVFQFGGDISDMVPECVRNRMRGKMPEYPNQIISHTKLFE
jgi:pantetheine-phosphate adenylyltransferase